MYIFIGDSCLRKTITEMKKAVSIYKEEKHVSNR